MTSMFHARLAPKAAAAAALACALLLPFPTPGAAQTRRARRPASAPAPPAAPASPQEFERVAAQASAAREGDRIDEAIGLYRRGLALRPDWTEGWWYLATLLYDRDNYAEALRAFRETARRQPLAGSPWAMMALCEFQLGLYDEAFTNLQKGRALGVGDNAELTRVMRYHEGLITSLKGEFERAQQTLGTLAYEGVKTEDLIIALGLSALRRGVLPREVGPGYPDRDLIRRTGLAEHLAAQKNIPDAEREYQLLTRDYPKAPGLHYSYGRFLLINRDDEGALAAFTREIENSPKHGLARIQVAYIRLKNRESEAALPFAEEAARLLPRLPLSHFVLGRVLLETGQSARAIEELEVVRRMVPDYPQVHFQLSRAYAKANRKADAEQARALFLQLSKKDEQPGAQGQPRADGLPAADDAAAPAEQPPDRP